MESSSGAAKVAPEERPWCWERFLREVAPRLSAILGGFRVPPSEREDLIQRALLGLLLKEAFIQNPEQWLFGALRYECRAYWRLRLREPEKVELSASLEPAPATDGGIAHFPAGQDVGRAVGRLAGRHRALIRLRYFEGCSPAETAASLHYSTKSLKKINSRCLKELRQELVDYKFGGR